MSAFEKNLNSTLAIHETELTIISENTKLEGTLRFSKVTRVHGTLAGEIHSDEGSLLILTQSSVVEGQIIGDSVLINGYVRGNVYARKAISIGESGRVVGQLSAPSIKVEFGAYLEGKLSISAESGRALAL